jgi:hypothetical protein
MSNEDVIFRRVNGRIVPIKVKKKGGGINKKLSRNTFRQRKIQKENNEKLKFGVSLTAGGLAMAAASSFIAGKAGKFASKRLINAARASRASRKPGQDRFVSDVFDIQSAKDYKAAMRANSASTLAAEIGIGLAATGLVSAGAERILESQGVKDSVFGDVAQNAVAGGLVGATAFGFRAAGLGKTLSRKKTKDIKFNFGHGLDFK